MLNRLSIQWKLILIIIFTAGFALLLVNVGIYRYTSSQTLGHMEQELKVLADIIGDRSTAALVFNDKKIAQENLQSLKANKTIISACLYNQHGELFSAYYREKDGGYCEGERYAEIFVSGGAEISYFDNANGKLEGVLKGTIQLKSYAIGYILIHSDLTDLNNINAKILRSAIIFSLIALASAAFLIWLVQGAITKPIYALAKTAMDVSERGDFSIRANKISNDETGFLTDQFNHMLETIQIQDEGLKEQQQRLEKLVTELDHQATHDALTGLHNRSGFESLVRTTIENMPEGQQSLLCYIDLDQFKIVNDSCGHVVGDEMLRRLAVIMDDVFSKHGHACRMGGDEFVVLLYDCNLQKGSAIIEIFLERISRLEFRWSGRHYPVSASVGIAIVNREAEFTDLLMQADSACYMAKDAGRNRMQLYLKDKADIDQRHSDIIMFDYLSRSESQRNFRLFVQPIYAHQTLTKVLSYEVLLRLLDSDNKLLSPAEFLPLAERFNLIPQIDRWVLRKVFEHVAQEAEGITYFINLSGLSVSEEGMSHYIKMQAEKLGIPTDKICFEITETTSIGSMGTAIEFITELRAIGFKFALDDFGSGYSTLDYLRRLPVDYIKLDGSLIENIHTDPISFAFAKAINDISHLANKKTIAEHISCKEIYDEVSVLGIDYCQGYWLGKPIELTTGNINSLTKPNLQSNSTQGK